ncbi:helix-turn-helix domain-containing protein [Clostridium perfringens]|uniref:helix-turn-helix domain-containing protein n=1 Tax=Clostridium perfringens TaxID=1502 RepID=UPI001A2156EF|nr:helix-turn-helix transcriptional regulator [Clostridium perfringens]MDH5076719.1 helix-turn-helix protein [Clostridium perfringens]MDK0639532.1 helix-turn-helix transcriptional regulator [Clostridium perfringens]MDM0630681.1 helix-turn-helix transcriptional regulator [Clostridium perfringens]MDM0642610.1 helix-turn-helix transcriptional regulator [Clostridium perfringens]MDM0749478.1 helix-turn-helix transcriptional regulator [Clostridium perfringens]
MNLDLNKLKLLQARACLSTNDLTDITGLSRVTISRVINGKGKATPKTIGLIAKALKVDVIELLSDEE